jgi:CubicO group peptidase (beta-lactamase class C family)
LRKYIPFVILFASTLVFGQIDTLQLKKNIDSIMTVGIQEQAFPGAQVLVAHQNKIIFHKTYGYHTYDSLQPVQKSDVYDLASVTKILAALPALMKLVEEGSLDLDEPFSKYWKPWRHQKHKKNITLREILAHQSGLIPYIVFQQKVMKKNGRYKNRFVSTTPTKKFHRPVFENLYVNERFQRKMYRIANRSKVSDQKKYVYSGLTFLLIPKLVEDLSGQPFDEYLKTNFYHPLAAKTLVFNPSKEGFQHKIVPTEIDSLFRKKLVKGWVHDENASLLGGVSGNAGLFGSAEDILKMMLMYQNHGLYEGKSILLEKTLKEFSRVQYPENENRRGLGFDKPLLGNDTLNLDDSYPAPAVSSKSFGHAGFTGTFVWADPENEITFIFLSNRVYPSRTHRNLYTMNIRETVQQLFYEAILSSDNIN